MTLCKLFTWYIGYLWELKNIIYVKSLLQCQTNIKLFICISYHHHHQLSSPLLSCHHHIIIKKDKKHFPIYPNLYIIVHSVISTAIWLIIISVNSMIVRTFSNSTLYPLGLNQCLVQRGSSKYFCCGINKCIHIFIYVSTWIIFHDCWIFQGSFSFIGSVTLAR